MRQRAPRPAARAAALRCALALATALMVRGGGAQAQSRTAWEMNAGEGVVSFFPPPMRNGDMSEYAHAAIPPPGDPGWGPAPDGTRVNYHVHSTLCAAGLMCLQGGDFTYFRTTLCVPDPRDVRSIVVRIDAVDDGARVSVFNAAFPNGVTPANGYAYLGGGAVTSGDFASDLRAGEPNTLVITHVDDCCEDSQLSNVQVLVNGRELVPGETAVEQCNGLDDDCDGETDEGFGDLHCGRGPCANTVPACANGAGQICRPLPGHPEACDGVDNDCNGLVDDVPGGCVDAGSEAPPDAAADAGENDGADGTEPDATMDVGHSCGSAYCDPSLRLEGRAGPIGSCLCSTPGVGPRGADGPGGTLVLGLLLAVRCARRKARP